MTTNAPGFIAAYFSQVETLLKEVDLAVTECLSLALLEAWRKGKRVLLMGNGGSSSSVSHIVNDLQKNLQLTTGRPLRTMCLSDCTPLMMAWANDTSWDNVFAPQVECWAEPGDVVIGVSGSGNSMNIINAIQAANDRGVATFGLAGYDGGKLKATAQHCLVVPSYNMQQIEDVHMILLHALFSNLLQQAKAESAVEAR
jgi:D-sedoheptulose 7-phosphate isomerase